jgi:hypothetical protein
MATLARRTMRIWIGLVMVMKTGSETMADAGKALERVLGAVVIAATAVLASDPLAVSHAESQGARVLPQVLDMRDL